MQSPLLNPDLVPPSRLYAASCIGNIAHECLQTQTAGIIQGLTSRGIFIKSTSRWLTFISYETFPGPLTINVPGVKDTGIKIEPGDQIEIASGKLSFKEPDLVITTRNINIWLPDPPVSHSLPVSERQKRLAAASRRVIRTDQLDDLPSLLPNLISIPDQTQIDEDQFPTYFKQILKLDRDSGGLPSTEMLSDLLGAGPGLTPSGDDFVIGLLLAINRWQHILTPNSNLDHFNQQIITAAYQKTTTLSANLLECAAQGLADQRLIDALDWLVSDNSGGMQAINELLTWGSSSGRDAFVGFVVALSLRN